MEETTTTTKAVVDSTPKKSNNKTSINYNYQCDKSCDYWISSIFYFHKKKPKKVNLK